MLLVKGNQIAFDMFGGAFIRPPLSDGLIHDPDGDVLDECEVLIGPYKITDYEAKMTRAATRYFGASFVGVKAYVDFPKGPWKVLGRVKKIFYTRTHGSEYAGKYVHAFESDQEVELSRSHKFLRLYLPDGCTVNWRGFVSP